MKQKKDTFSQAIVGLFMIVLLGLLIYFTIIISGIDLITGRERRPVNIAFAQVGGLKEHDNVLFRGTKVGTIEHIEVTPSNLLVTAGIDEQVILRQGYRVSVCSFSMLGGTYLQLEEGSGAPIDLQTVTLVGETPTDWLQDMARLSRNLSQLTGKEEWQTIITNTAAISARVRAISENADKVVARIERGEGLLGKLIMREDTLYDDMSESVREARAALGEARAAFGEAHAIATKLNRDKTFADLEAGVAAFRAAAESMDAKETMAKANLLLDNLNAVSEALKNGEGTLGRLAKDPKMYDEIDGLIRDVRQVIDNYRDTTPISTFSSLAVGAF